MKLNDVPFFQRPIGPMQATGGVDELGNPVHRNGLTGAQFAARPQQTQQREGSALRQLWEALRTKPVETAKAAATGAAQGVWDGVSAPARAARGETVTHGDAWATAGSAVGGASAGAVPDGALGANSFRAYHGSPHDFDKFSMDKIGTGVGAPDAYSRGLYFAESPKQAEWFRDLAAGPVINGKKTRAGLSDDAYEMVWKFVNDGGNGTLADVAGIARKEMDAGGLPYSAQRHYQGTVDELEARSSDTVGQGAHVYEVDINADPSSFADWDAPISQQSEVVRGALSKFPEDKTWREIYESGRVDPGTMRERGVPGTTYKASDGSRNFVVFDDNLISIVRRYGIAGAAAMLGVSASEIETAMSGA